MLYRRSPLSVSRVKCSAPVAFAALAGFALVVALAAHHLIGYGVNTWEYLKPAYDLADVHRIQSEFAAIGYSAMLGAGMMINRRTGMTIANAAIYAAMVASLWAFLRTRKLPPAAAAVSGMIVLLLPSLWASIFKVLDSNVTALFLLLFLACTLAIVDRPRWGVDVFLGLALGIAIATRTNLALLLPVSWMVWKKYGVPQIFPRIGLQLCLTLFSYAVLTVAVHGRVFLPYNGAYNLFAGANEYTLRDMAHFEDSLAPAMHDRGYDAVMNWNTNPDQPGVTDYRDHKFAPIYRREALKYIAHHPLQDVQRSVRRLGIFLEPDLEVHPAATPGGLLKLIAFAVLPLWFLACLFLRTNRDPAGDWMVAMTVFVYMVPFILLIATPRFRVPLEIVCLADLLARLYHYRMQRAAKTPA